MEMRVTITGMTIDVQDEKTARLYQSRGFAVPVEQEVDARAQRKRAPRKTKTDK